MFFLKKYLPCVFIFLFICADTAMAAGHSVAIVLSKDTPTFHKMAGMVKAAIIKKEPSLELDEYIFSKEPDFISKIIITQPSLIVTVGSVATKVITNKIKDIPVVFFGVLRMDGIYDGQPNVTGVYFDVPIKFQLDVILKVIPGVKTIGLIYSVAENSSLAGELFSTAKDRGLEVKLIPVVTAKDIGAIKKMDFDILLFVPDTVVCQPSALKIILVNALNNNIPTVGISSEYARAGSMIAVAPDYSSIGDVIADSVLKIFGGTKPSGLPMTNPPKSQYFLNLMIAKRLDINLSEDTISGATEVFGQ